MEWWLWFIFGFALLAGEIFTPGAFFMLFFGLGAIIVGLIAVSGVVQDTGIQWLLFTGVSMALLVTLRRWLLTLATPPASKTDRDDLVGSGGNASEDMAPGKSGRVSVRGSEWSAVNVGNYPISKGGRISVRAVKGLTLDVAKSDS